jgi:hypothetical protein
MWNSVEFPAPSKKNLYQVPPRSKFHLLKENCRLYQKNRGNTEKRKRNSKAFEVESEIIISSDSDNIETKTKTEKLGQKEEKKNIKQSKKY